MKKITFVFVLIFFLIVQTPLYVQYHSNELEGALISHCAYSDLKDAGDLQNPEAFAQAVTQFAKEQNAVVAAFSYQPLAGRDQAMQLYLAGDAIPAFLRQKGVTQEVLRTLDTAQREGDETAIALFNPDKSCTVHRFSDLANKSLARSYYVYPKEAGAAFQTFLREKHGVDFFSADELIYLQSAYIDQIPGVTLMAAALLVFWAFWVVSEYQRNAVKKLNGYSDVQCGAALFAKFGLVTLAAFLTSVAAGFLGCGVYNRWTHYTGLLGDALRICLPVLAALLALGVVFLLLFYSADVKYALKGKKPYGVLTACAAVLQVITIVFLCASINTIGWETGRIQNILKQESRFEQISSCYFTQFSLLSGSVANSMEFDQKGNRFYQALDGILMDSREIRQVRSGGPRNNTPTENMVLINQNYLTVNPIYDAEGKAVSIDEAQIADNELIFLIPEQYRGQEAELYAYFDAWYNHQRYGSIPTTELPREERVTSIRFWYVRDHQTYFAYGTTVGDFAYNYIEDPFAALVTRKNMDVSHYSNFMVNSQYFLYQNEEQTLDDILRAAKQAGVDEDLSNVPTVGSAVESVMQECRTKMLFSITILVLSVLIVATICIYMMKTYMEQHKRLFFIKKMLGYPPMRIYGGFILLATLVQLLVFVVLKFALPMALPGWLAACAGFLGMDFLLMWTVALTYQNTLTKNVLKGEGI